MSGFFITGDYKLDIARGLTKARSVHRIGFSGDVDTNTVPVTLWSEPTPYPWSSFDTAGVINIVSDSTEDAEGNDGATEVVVEGLDSDFNEITETFSLDGTTGVVGEVEFKRVYKVRVSSGETNVGNITATLGGVTISKIEAGVGQSLMGIYTIPSGYNGYLLAGDFSIQKNKDAQIRMYVRTFGEPFNIAHIAEVYENTYRYDFPIPQLLPPKSDIDVRVYEVETNNTRASCNFDLILIPL